MWNSIVNAAKGIYNAIIPSKPAPTPTVTPSSGGLQVKPIVTQPTLSVKPIAPTPNISGVLSPAQVSAQQQASLKVAPIPGQTTTDFAAQQKAAQTAAVTKQQSALSKIWQAALTPAAKLGNLYAQYQGKQYTKKILTQQNAGIPDMVNRWQGNADAKMTQARQDLASGKISVQQYNAILDAEKAKMEKNAASYTDLFNSEQKQVDAPYPGAKQVGGAVDAFQKFGGGIFGNIWKYTLGSGGQNVPSLITLPGRALNLARNTIPGADKSPANVGNAWQKTYNQSVLPGSVLNSPNFKKLPGWRKEVAGAVADPVNFIGAGWLGKSTSWLPKVANAVGKTDFGKAVVGGAKTVANSRFGQTVAKLGEQSKSTNQAWLDKVHETLNGKDNKFAALNHDETQAYQDLMQGKKVDWTASTDKAKVTKFAAEQRALYDAMHKAENAGGIGTKYHPNYLPTKSRTTDDKSSFLFKKTNAAAKGFTGDQLRRAEAFRQWEHLNALKSAGLTDNAGKAFTHLAKKPLSNKAYAGMFKSGVANPKILRAAPDKRFFSTDTSTLAKIPRKAESAWKSAVLKYNPAWYVHNAMWNVPASFLAGGTKTFGGYAKMFRKGAQDALPQELKDGAFGGLGGKLENISRGAAYHAGIAKGLSHEKALEGVNKYLFDYSQHANWEKPIRAALPFWSWQKNIARLATQLPNSNPLASNVFHQIDQNNQRGLDEIPAKGVSYKDPETGRTLSVDPRKQFEGKIKTPWGWISAAGLPILPSQLSQFGVNPLLSTAKRFFTGKDYFGNSTNGETIGSLAASNTPQTKLVQSMHDMLTKSGTTENWISASGYSKGAQGIDPSKPNYKATLDPTHNFFAAIKSLSGAPFPTKFDEARFRESVRYDQFSKEYFSHDWSKEFPASTDYNAKVAAQQAIAKKFGYDLQKDIYDGKWSKYDSEDTAKLKARGDAARQLQDQVYALYNKLPAKTGAKSQFISMWKSQMADPEFKKFNPDFNVFKNIPIKGEVPGAKGGFSNVASTKFATPTVASAKSNFWKQYYATTDKTARSAMLKANPQYSSFKTAATDPNKAKIAWAYKTLPPDVRTSWLRKEGLLDPAKANWTSAQWQTYLASTGNDPASKLGRDLISYPSLGQSQLDQVNKIVSSFKPIGKIGNSVKFGRGFGGRKLTKTFRA